MIIKIGGGMIPSFGQYKLPTQDDWNELKDHPTVASRINELDDFEYTQDVQACESRQKNFKYFAKKDICHKILNKISWLPTYLQGNRPVYSLQSYISDLEYYRQHSSDPNRLTDLIKNFKEALELEIKYEALSELKEPSEKKPFISDIANQLATQLNQLPEGKTLVFTGGSLQHTVLFEIECVREDDQILYQLKILNSGLGNEYHYKSSLKWLFSGDRYSDYVLKNVKQRQLDARFFQELLTPYLLKPQPKNIILKLIQLLAIFFFGDRGMTKVYKTVQSLTKNKDVARVYEPALNHREQGNGVCSNKCLAFLAHERLGKDYENFKLFSQIRALEKLPHVGEFDLSASSPSIFLRIKSYFDYLFFDHYMPDEQLYAQARDKISQRVFKP